MYTYSFLNNNKMFYFFKTYINAEKLVSKLFSLTLLNKCLKYDIIRILNLLS